MAYQYLKEISPPGEYEHIQAAAYYDLTFQKDTPEGQQAFAALTPAERSFYDDLRAAKSPAIVGAHHRLMAGQFAVPGIPVTRAAGLVRSGRRSDVDGSRTAGWECRQNAHHRCGQTCQLG